MAPRLGDQIEDFTFLTPDGEPLPLRAFEGRPLVLIFLRHLA